MSSTTAGQLFVYSVSAFAFFRAKLYIQLFIRRRGIYIYIYSPIFKEGDKADCSSYRSISILPVVSRIFEKLIYNQLYDYLDPNKLLSSRQSGFRSLHPVVTCILKSTDKWYISMNNSHYTAVAFIDLKKAFVTVDHSILLKKMGKYRIRGTEMSWFHSYLKFRRQLFRVNRENLETQNTEIGVPQGSCLRPHLFLLYLFCY